MEHSQASVLVGRLGSVAAVSDPTAPTIETQATISALVEAAHLAFAEHRPLLLSPDAIWLTLIHGLAAHLEKSPGNLREQLVLDTFGQTLCVSCDELGWQGLVDRLSERVRDFTQDGVFDLLTPEFSTTGPVERAAFRVGLLKTLSPFFEYQGDTVCGIPQVSLSGSLADWELLRARVEPLAEFGLRWWTPRVVEILDRCVEAFQGLADPGFWQSLYHYENRSGRGPTVSGWLTSLFPYLADGRRNLAPFGSEVSLAMVPDSLASAPFAWNYRGSTFEMQMLGGLTGVGSAQGTLYAQPGWLVRSHDARFDQLANEHDRLQGVARERRLQEAKAERARRLEAEWTELPPALPRFDGVYEEYSPDGQLARLRLYPDKSAEFCSDCSLEGPVGSARGSYQFSEGSLRLECAGLHLTGRVLEDALVVEQSDGWGTRRRLFAFVPADQI
ncbi:MAG: DUF4419 domain-containing protein [Candidatus Eremiobacteraeota bacterium]|nr:DUF4419 domain-containing protein [Candidatus Eremiobacteraeota bacterium]